LLHKVQVIKTMAGSLWSATIGSWREKRLFASKAKRFCINCLELVPSSQCFQTKESRSDKKIFCSDERYKEVNTRWLMFAISFFKLHSVCAIVWLPRICFLPTLTFDLDRTNKHAS